MEVNYVFDEPALLTMNCHQLLVFGPAVGSHLKQQAIISRMPSPLALTSSNRPLPLPKGMPCPLGPYLQHNWFWGLILDYFFKALFFWVCGINNARLAISLFFCNATHGKT